MTSASRPEGVISIARIPLAQRPAIHTVADAILHGSSRGRSMFDRSPIARFQRANRANFERSIRDQAAFEHGDREALGNILGVIGHLWLSKIGRNGIEDYGLVSCRVVTTVGVKYIVDAFQNLVEAENMKYHGIGTGTAAESASNTALSSELTTQYSTSNTRATGTTGAQSGNSNVYETSATVTVSAAVAVTEHGVFSSATAGGGVLLDRSVFAPVNLASGESLQVTYSLTFPSGG